MSNKIERIFAIVFLVLIQPLALYAQGADTISEEDFLAPFIDHSALDESLPEKESLDIQATISDNIAVQKAVLFFRSGGGSQKQEKYIALNMEPSGGDIYSVTIPGTRVVGHVLEYYIQASDTAGNTAYRGNESAPLTVSIGAGPVLPETALFSTQEEVASNSVYTPSRPWYKKWWVWAIGGAVLVGAAAGGGGGSDGASSGAGNNPGGLQVTW